MSLPLRIILIVISLLCVSLVFYTVNRKHMQLSDSLVWLLVSFLMIEKKSVKTRLLYQLC